jgi:phosphohistidine phosphatase
MKKIILMRHGKSSFSDPDQDDLDRPLNARGRVASALMGAWLADAGLTAALAILSPARRARETWAKAAPNLPGEIETVEERALYMADPGTMLEIVRRAPDSAETLILVGHQPSMSAFARKMTGGKAPGGCKAAFEKFPTAGVAILEVDVDDWRKVEFGAADFLDFATPKDLV